MGVIEIVGSILLLIVSIILIVIVLMQNTNSDGMGAVGGAGSDSYYGRNKGRTIDAILARWTKYIGIALFVITILVNLAIVLFK